MFEGLFGPRPTLRQAIGPGRESVIVLGHGLLNAESVRGHFPAPEPRPTPDDAEVTLVATVPGDATRVAVDAAPLLPQDDGELSLTCEDPGGKGPGNLARAALVVVELRRPAPLSPPGDTASPADHTGP